MIPDMKTEHLSALGHSSVLSLDELIAVIRSRFGSDVVITQREYWMGCSEAILSVNGVVRASWRGRLVNIPPLDGVTPRGVKEYYDLEFYGENGEDRLREPCPHDTDGDGDCHLCAGKGGCFN